ncbi:MAG: aspartate kinase [Anaerolineae bacterium]|nr:aspartate kinase [Anaerolineae bacterium]
MQILKFGGTSVGDAKAIAQTMAIVADQIGRDAQTVVVTSAMRGVTDLLIDSAKAAAAGDRQRYREARQTLIARHRDAAEALIADLDELTQLQSQLDERVREFERLCMAVAILGELTDRGLAVISGLGERLMAPLLAAALRGRGIPAEFVDAGELIVTDDIYLSGNPLMEATRHKTRERLLPLLAQGRTPVTTGFVAATADGIPTVLGRGGSDYSAAILGAALDADEVQIWTDVDGVLTADPRIVPDARPLAELSYTEAAELAYFGAKVLHPKTMLPCIDRGIPIRVLNTFNPVFPGTRVVAKATNGGVVKALTVIRGLALVTVAGRGMMGVPGIAARTFAAVAAQGANVLMISQASSEQSICFVVPEGDTTRVAAALEATFAQEIQHRAIERVSCERNIVIVAVVGEGMRGTPGIAARLFGALGDRAINVIAIAQGSSEANISLALAAADADIAVRAIHAAFKLGGRDHA